MCIRDRYIEERVALKNIINELRVEVSMLNRLSHGFPNRVHNVDRLDSISLSEVESIQDYLKSIYKMSMESLEVFQQGTNDLSDLVDEIKNRKSGGGA